MTALSKLITRNWFCYVLITAVTFLVWGQTISYGFVWDDRLFITNNKSIYFLKNIPSMFYSLDAQSAMPDICKLFRPLRTMVYAILYAIQYKISGHPAPNPWIFHFTNVATHAVAAILLFSVMCRLLAVVGKPKDFPAHRTLALLTAIAFAVHPVTSEVVCWAKSLDDIMAAVFVLASLRELLKWDGKAKGYCYALLYFVLAAYSKESAVPFALLVFFILDRIHQIPTKQNLKLSSGFFVAAILYAIHRHFVMGRSSQIDPISGTYGQTLIDMLQVLIKYARLLLGIPPFHIDYSFLPSGLSIVSVDVIVGVVIAIAFVAATIWLWRRNGFSLVGFGLAWIAVFFVPVSNLIPMMQYMAERFLYLPLIGFLFVIAAILLRYCRISLANAILAVIICLWIPISLIREQIWHDELTLFVQSVVQGPWTKRVEKNAIVAIFKLPTMHAVFPDLAETGDLTMAETISPQSAQAAIETLSNAQPVFPNSEVISSALGLIYAKAGRLSEAVSMLQLATKQNPSEPRCWYNLAFVQFQNKQNADALASCEKALAINPNYVAALELELQIFSQSGDLRSALKRAERLQALTPGDRGLSARIQNLRIQLGLEKPITPLK